MIFSKEFNKMIYLILNYFIKVKLVLNRKIKSDQTKQCLNFMEKDITKYNDLIHLIFYQFNDHNIKVSLTENNLRLL